MRSGIDCGKGNEPGSNTVGILRIRLYPPANFMDVRRIAALRSFVFAYRRKASLWPDQRPTRPDFTSLLKSSSVGAREQRCGDDVFEWHIACVGNYTHLLLHIVI
jgi:hypothetical protein